MFARALRKPKRYREAISYFDRTLALAPDFEAAKFHRAMIHLLGYGDPRPLRKYLSELPPHQTRVGGLPPNEILYFKWRVEYYSGDFQAALNVLAETGEETFNFDRHQYNRWHLEGMTLYRMGGIDSARTALETACSEYEKRLKGSPNNISVTGMLGVVVAALGERDGAIEIGNHVLELCATHERGKFWMGRSRWPLSLIYTLVGEYDKAFDILDFHFLSGTNVSVHFVRNDPNYAELRRQPRWRDFEKKHALGEPVR